MIIQPKERIAGNVQIDTETVAVKTAPTERQGGEGHGINSDGFVPGDRLCCGGAQLGKFVGKIQILNSWLS